MKLIQILKVAAIPVLTVFSLLSASNQALADYLTSQGSGGHYGSGGYYRYELWSTDDNNYYYLKVWSSEASSNSEAHHTTTTFTSSRDALIYFDCNYAERSLPECPR